MAHAILIIVDDRETCGFLRARLGNGSGFESITGLRSRTCTPNLAISACDEEREKVRALDLGADDYLTKPLAGDELLARIRKASRVTASDCT